MVSQFTLVAAILLPGHAPPVAGSISGVVFNASQEDDPVPGAEVILRVKLEGRFVTAAEATADSQGRFLFDNIPADDEYIYLPGANRADIHYPGPRVRLGARTPHAHVKLIVHDAVAHPSPLVLRRQDVTLHPETDALRVTEVLLIENPSSCTYVGRPPHEGGRAATLRLLIPADFRRTTFNKEFYGRQFSLIGGQLVTDIPWTPGQREVAFTYVLPNEQRRRIWRRPLDLPCEHLRISVHTDKPDKVTCNLPHAASQSGGAVVFESTGQTLPAGHLVHVNFAQLPISLAIYARWLALASLVVLVTVTSLLGTRYRQAKQSQTRSYTHLTVKVFSDRMPNRLDQSGLEEANAGSRFGQRVNSRSRTT